MKFDDEPSLEFGQRSINEIFPIGSIVRAGKLAGPIAGPALLAVLV